MTTITLPELNFIRPTSETLTNSEVEILRHGNGRKLNDWDEAYSREEYVCISTSLYNKLVKWNVPPLFTPFDTLPEEIHTHQFFIAKTCEKDYLVNTEGYTYARYTTKFIVCDNDTEYTDFEFSLIKHFCGRNTEDWKQAEYYVEPIQIFRSLYDKLPKFDVSHITPKDKLPEDIYKKRFFIAKHGNKEFIVNTEGYPYSRYVAPIEVRL
jgi:hypothetical protein